MGIYDADTYFMEQALTIAGYALGRTSPNPLVGAVIVKDGRIVGQGWHRKAGEAHAEVHALHQAGALARGATIYVTLEPCCHHGRTGPCAEALIEAGIKRAIVAMKDPNPLVSGMGIERLRAAGVEVEVGKLAAKAAALNEVFLKWVSTGMPFVAMKTAMSLDGKIAAHTGDSKWITQESARAFAHTLRDKYDAILVGVGTLLTDDPALTTRLLPDGGGKNAVRIVLDSMARTPLTSKVVVDKQAETIIAVAEEAPPERMAALQARGMGVLPVKSLAQFGGLDLRSLLKMLSVREITSVLVEGGSRVNASFLEANLVDKVYWFIAPKIIGGQNAPGPVGGAGVSSVEKAVWLEDTEIKRIGEDFLLSANVVGREGRDVYRACGRIGQSEEYK